MEKVTMSLPMVALRGMTILPEMVRHFDVSREKSLAAIDEAMEGEQMLFVSAQKDVATEDPGLEDVYETGCIVTVRQIVKMPKKISRVLITGEKRAKIRSLEFKEPYLRALVDVVEDVDTGDEENGGESAPLNKEAMLRGLRDIFKEYMLKNPKIYYNFFFGKHGQDFGSLFKRYYELFPEEADKLSPDLMDMYYGKNIQERCMKLLLTIKDKDNQITSKNINMINTIIVASVKYILEQKCMEPELDSDILTRDLMNIIEYTISK